MSFKSYYSVLLEEAILNDNFSKAITKTKEETFGCVKELYIRCEITKCKKIEGLR